MVGPKATVVLQRVTRTDDNSGGSTEAWSDLCSITGSLISPTGNQRLSHDKVEIASTHVFVFDQVIAYTITEDDKLKYGARSFIILYVSNPGEKNQHTALHLQEIK